MKTFAAYIRSMRIGRNTLQFLFILLFGLAIYYLMRFVMPPTGAFSQFPVGILRIYLGIGALMWMDKVYHSEIDTTRAIIEKNTAYSQIILAEAIIIAAVMMTI